MVASTAGSGGYTTALKAVDESHGDGEGEGEITGMGEVELTGITSSGVADSVGFTGAEETQPTSNNAAAAKPTRRIARG